MSEELSQISIEEIRAKVAVPNLDIRGPVAVEEEALKPLVMALKISAIDFVNRVNNNDNELKNMLKKKRYLDGIVASMRHVEGGQDFILREIQRLKPDICWYRGGTLKKWRDEISSASAPYFSQEQLDTQVIDGGKNGVLGRPNLALSYFKIYPRANPTLYTLTINDLIDGLRKKAIYLTSEHDYDLNVAEGNSRTEYLNFCKNNLKIQRVALDQK